MLKAKKILSLFLAMLLVITMDFTNVKHTYAASVSNPAKVIGATADFASNVKALTGINYTVKDLGINDLLKPGYTYTNGKITPVNTSSSLTGTKISTPGSGGTEALKYPIGTKSMILDSSSKSFNPQKGTVYYDPKLKSAFKILDSASTDAQGNKIIPVIQPEFSEVFKTYKIPQQSVKLNKDNISFKKPGVTVQQLPEQPMKLDNNKFKPQLPQLKTGSRINRMLASNGPVNLGPVASSDDVMFQLDLSQVVLYEYPEPKSNDEKDKSKDEELKKDDSEVTEDDGSLRDNQTDTSDEDKNQEDTPPPNLAGVEEKSNLNVKVYIESGQIIIHKPTFFVNVDIGALEQEIKVGLDYKTDMNLTVKGNLKFDKVAETCILGYDIEIPYGKAFVGVFLVVDAKGKVEITTKVVTTGHIETGFKASAFCFVPYYVGPYCAYKPDTFDIGFVADGEISAKAAAVPKVGLTILDFNVGELQLWAGLKANAKFHAEDNLHVDVNDTGSTKNSVNASGSLKVDFFVDVIGYLFGHKYDIFYKEFNLFDGAWAVGQQASGGGGGENLTQIPAVVSVMADAKDDIIKGSVKSISDNTPYKGANLNVHVQHTEAGGVIDNITVATNEKGEFEIKADKFDKVKTVRPLDYVWADINTSVVLSKITDSTGNEINAWIDPVNTAAGGRIKGQTTQIEPTVPFDKVSFVADAFNDIVRGQVSGDYTGPISIIYQKQGAQSIQIGAQVNKGEFIKEFAAKSIKKGDLFTVKIPFEGVYYPKYPETKEANLPYLKINYTVLKENPNNTFPTRIIGSVENMMAEYDQQYDVDGYKPVPASKYNSAYLGDVKLMSISNNAPDKLVLTQKTVTLKLGSNKINGTNIKLPTDISSLPTKNAPKSSSKFSFNQVPLMFAIMIEHDGIKKWVIYDPLSELAKRFNQPLEEAVTNPVEDKINSIINPADIASWAGVWQCDYLGTMILRVEGNKLKGTYDSGNFEIEATVSGSKLIGTLNEDGASKSFELNLSSDGKKASGKYFISSSRTGGVSLSATRKKLPSMNVLSPAIAKTSWTGVWYTAIGTMILNQEGSNVAGFIGYNDTPFNGTVTGNTFKGSYKENGIIKQFEITLSSDGTSFEGLWGEGENPEYVEFSGYR